MRGALDRGDGLCRGSPDHPRGCGEHPIRIVFPVGFPGSSPRMRGARRWPADSCAHPRIIPADAGSTWNSVLRTSVSKDHPRGCGEHVVMSPSFSPFSGSSPRMRGAPIPFPRIPFPHRIIPADAGSTETHSVPSMRFRDHPRGCGEHYTLHNLSQYQARIIPADAGSTRWWVAYQDRSWDHPRGCGEHTSPTSADTKRQGSSPRMRGALGVDTITQAAARIIPADAGSTRYREYVNHLHPDHPRGCGEHGESIRPQ